MFLWTAINHLNYLPDIFPHDLSVQTQSSATLNNLIQLSLCSLSPYHEGGPYNFPKSAIHLPISYTA